MITVQADETKAALFFSAMGKSIRANIARTVQAQTLLLEGHIKADKLSGQVLNRVTGNLRASIHSEFQDTGDQIIGRVYSDGTVKYGAIHEYGGIINIPDIYPVKAQALHFFAGGKEIFAKHVKAHQVNMPERSFMRSALADQRDAIIAALRAAIVSGLKGQ